ncbi:MAG: CRISPR-associated protein Cas4 [Moritella sp.]|nr:MAG: CRISPR-associated protein Cas4 [Moritella sp.]
MSVPASLIRQYCFCPRIPYFQHIIGIKAPTPLWVQQGLDFHQRARILSKSRTLKRYNCSEGSIMFDVKLKSKVDQIHGIADALIFTEDEIIVVEFKLSCRRPTRGQKQQLAAYALCAELQYRKPVSKGYISYESSGKAHFVKLDNKLKADVGKTVGAIIQMEDNQLIPDTAASSEQCGQCEYLNFCNDR